MFYCFKGYCSLDGLEKVTRPMCALQKEKVKGGQSMETKVLNIMQCCPDSPIMGGKCKTPSKFCLDHKNEKQADKMPSISPPDFKYYESNSSGEVPLPDNEDDKLLGRPWYVVSSLTSLLAHRNKHASQF